jgi:terminal uridylyltransferase
MDLCVLLEGNEQGEPRTRAAELVTLIGSLLERGQSPSPSLVARERSSLWFVLPLSETNFAVKALPKAYVPIIKLSLSPSPGLPFGIAVSPLSSLPHFIRASRSADLLASLLSSAILASRTA